MAENRRRCFWCNLKNPVYIAYHDEEWGVPNFDDNYLYGSFYAYLHSFTGGRTLYEAGNTANSLSDAISKDLQKRGMKFVGSTIIYSYLQAVGIIVSHEKDCYLYKNARILAEKNTSVVVKM